MDRLADTRLVFDRACEHDKAWQVLLDDWAKEENRYSVGGHLNPLTGWLDVRLSMSEPPPKRASVIYADLVHNLRATLDHIVCHLVEINGGTCTRSVGFPRVKNVEHWPSAVERHLVGFPTLWIPEIEAAQPFQYGTDFRKHPMHVLHELDIQQKHRTAVHFGVTAIELDFAPVFNRPKLLGDRYVLHQPTTEAVEIKDGDVIARLQPISQHNDLRITGIKGTHGPLMVGPLSDFTQGIGDALANLTCFVGWVLESLAPAFP